MFIPGHGQALFCLSGGSALYCTALSTPLQSGCSQKAGQDHPTRLSTSEDSAHTDTDSVSARVMLSSTCSGGVGTVTTKHVSNFLLSSSHPSCSYFPPPVSPGRRLDWSRTPQDAVEVEWENAPQVHAWAPRPPSPSGSQLTCPGESCLLLFPSPQVTSLPLVLP